jgi:dTDP-4-amino-4,6-dideoxygalactose transaminase
MPGPGLEWIGKEEEAEAGDGGMVVTDDEELYVRAFGYHDQGHFPGRSGAEIGNRSLIGQNYRMNELTAAVLIAQFRRLELILGHLRRLKARLKNGLAGVPGLAFRRINDTDGECATILTVFLPSRAAAEKVAAKLGTTTVVKSGRHVYGNMEQILGKKMMSGSGCPFDCASHPCEQDYRAGMLPRTDRLVERAINVSVGVVDAGLGAGFGVHPRATDDEVDAKARQLSAAVREAV